MFSKNKSCQTNLILCFERVTGFVNWGELLATVYFDFGKPFDNVT